MDYKKEEKFELTNQDSAGGENFTVLIAIRQLFSLEMAENEFM